jgi:sugar phosphate permease
MALDMFAVIFGGATALLPIYAEDVLKVGATGYGVLLASADAGALLVSIVLVMRRPVVNTGRTLILSVVVFGFATAVFGLSRSFPVSIAFYMLIGMADQVSVVMRNTTIQMATPDHLRGRVSAVSQVFIQSSNQAGAIESGVVAAVTSATFAVVSGGVGAMAVAGLVGVKLRGLWTFRVGDVRAEDAKAEGTASAP